MKALIVGCGNIGSVAARDLARSSTTIDITLADQNSERAKHLAGPLGSRGASWLQLDVEDHDSLVHTLKDFDVAVGFLPGDLGYLLAEACIDAETNLVDVSYMPEDPLKLNERATAANITIVPDCGLAPGLSNLLVGHSFQRLDTIRSVRIMVGGLPERPLPPLDYVVTWSPENLIDEYTRKTRIVKDGRTVEVETLSGLERVEFPNLGTLEAFYTDGLRTLPSTIMEVEEMWEKTLRYPGHAEKIRLLRALGFFDLEPINIDGISLSPRKITAKLLEKRLKRSDVKDIVAMRIEVLGIKNHSHIRQTYQMLDRYDEKQNITAMARTTAYPASITTQLLMDETVSTRGVIPPERLGADERLFNTIVRKLHERGVKITEEEIILD